MDNKVILETERLILRPWEDKDALDLVEGLNNLNVSKWLAAVPYPYTMDDAISFINYTKTKEKDYNLVFNLFYSTLFPQLAQKSSSAFNLFPQFGQN